MLFVKVPSGDRMPSIDSAEEIHGMFKMEGADDIKNDEYDRKNKGKSAG